MATSKEYSQREMIIDRYLSTGKEYDGQTLMGLVNKELRTRGMEEITARSTFASDINEINSKFFYQYHKNEIRRERRGNYKMSVHVVSPYYLKQSGLRWYLLAAYKGNPNVYTFALDRIVSVEFIDCETYEPTDVDYEHYFDNIVGVTDYTNRPVEHVEIWVGASELPYILSKPLHHTQMIVSQDDKGAIISIDVKLNYELEQTILSYGEGIEVMKPVELREKLNRRIQKLQSIYKTSEPG